MRKKIVAFTGAGISAESGIKTFRDHGGLWENYEIEDVATPQAWKRNPKLVLDFYNERRKKVASAKPNDSHLLLAQLEKDFDVSIITQNIDDLHEKAGSTNILHLHGEIFKMRSDKDERIVSPIYDDIQLNAIAPDGGKWRPHIVWFGEAVPHFSTAAEIIKEADIFIIVGTSLQVQPAASLIYYCKKNTEIYYIDPNPSLLVNESENFHIIKATATQGLKTLYDKLV